MIPTGNRVIQKAKRIKRDTSSEIQGNSEQNKTGRYLKEEGAMKK